MHQTTFDAFFAKKSAAGCTTARTGAEVVTSTPDTVKVETGDNMINAENRKRDREGDPKVGSDTEKSSLTWDRPKNDYYATHAAEYASLTQNLVSPPATSMAKLFHDDLFGCTKYFRKVWSPPAAGPDLVPYAAVVDVLADISATGSRLECVKLLTYLLLAVMERCPQNLVPVIYLVINKQAPQHEGVELGIGDSLLVKVVAECCGMTEARVKEEYIKTGDLAEIAQDNKQKQSTLMKPKPLTAQSVFTAFRDMAKMSGKDVMRRRSDIIKRLLRDAQGPEVNFIVRGLQQKMRIGLAEPSALAAVGYAFALHFVGRKVMTQMSPEDLQLLLGLGAANFARIFYEVPSIDVVVSAVLEHGFMVLVPGSSVANAHKEDLSIRPGLPVKPQLAHPTSGISVVLDRFQEKRFTSEYKYDGERAQIHYKKGSGFQIFSRNSETHTGKYPDLISMLPGTFNMGEVDSFIIDSEVVAVDPATGALQAFQVLQHRGRKNIDEKNVTIPVCVFAFDILYFNGAPLLTRNLSERRAVLWKWFTPLPSKLAFATYLDSDNVEDIQKFLEKSIADGCEGLMVKTLEEEATYTPAKRSHYWLKLKKDYMDGVTDTVDLVPIAAFFGKGKRTGVFGNFLLACYDNETDEYQSICKIGTGFQDSDLVTLTESLKPFIAAEKPRYYRTADEEEVVWLNEAQVWEVKAADLSVSPKHFAAIGLVDPSRGIALRFPRFLRQRDDKKPVDATSAQQIAEMYKAQSLAMKGEDDGEESDS